MKSNYLTCIILLLATLPMHAQLITGTVSGVSDANEKTPLPYATVAWLGTNIGVVTDDAGKFSITRTNMDLNYLVFSFVGYESDTIEVGDQTNIHAELRQTELIGVTVEGESSATTINTISPTNIVTINEKELRRAACCNLSESFETNASVDAEFSDAVTGARTIKLLGLDGVYSQIMIENMPNVRGLSSSYGLTFIPGPWIESIQITKGPGSVVNGYESMTGAINTEIKKPFHADEEAFLLNLFGSTAGRMEANILGKYLFSEKWSTALYAHTSQLNNKMDHNDDGFIDAPLNNTYALMNKWNYFSGKVLESQFGVKYIYSDLLGGQLSFDENEERTTDNGYGVNVHIERFEAFAKNGFLFERPNTSIGTIVNYYRHNQSGYFGLNNYTGSEDYANVNLIGQTFISNTNHLVKGGFSYLYNGFDETFDSVSYSRIEHVPGVFAEYFYSKPDSWSMLAGLRADLHNLYGVFISPRLHLKYNITPQTTLRASGGKGYRTANIFAENTTLLTSNREIVILEDLNPEESWNYGLTFVQLFEIDEKDGIFTLDAYRTDFVNQAVVNTDSSVHAIYISNLHGDSYSNILQAEIGYNFFRNFEAKVAYKFIDAKTTYGTQLLEVPLTSRHRGLLNMSYKTPKEDWQFDFTTQYYGQSRLPDLSENHSAHHLGKYSEDYFLLLGQITKKFKWFEVYIGSENLTNYTQHAPIIGSDDPFGEDFDASVIYAPTMERKFYMGLTMSLN